MHLCHLLVSERSKDEQKILLSGVTLICMYCTSSTRKMSFQCGHFSREIINLGNVQFYGPESGVLLHTME